jgi:hypothetical protein
MGSEEDLLREMAADEDVPAHLRLGALKELGRRGEPPEGRSATDGDPEAAMEAVIARIAPEPPELAKAPADPTRDLDFQALVGRPMDSIALGWLPNLPAGDKRTAERDEKEVVAAARRLGVGRGPHEIPESGDELAARRRRRSNG